MEDQLISQETEQQSIVLSQTSISYLQSSIPWMKFVSIIGYIITGLVFSGLIFSFVFMGTQRFSSSPYSHISSIIICCIFIAVFFKLNSHLFKNATLLRDGIKTNDSSTIEKAFNFHKKFWTISGIILLIYLSIFFIVLIYSLFSHL